MVDGSRVRVPFESTHTELNVLYDFNLVEVDFRCLFSLVSIWNMVKWYAIDHSPWQQQAKKKNVRFPSLWSKVLNLLERITPTKHVTPYCVSMVAVVLCWALHISMGLMICQNGYPIQLILLNLAQFYDTERWKKRIENFSDIFNIICSNFCGTRIQKKHTMLMLFSPAKKIHFYIEPFLRSGQRTTHTP